MKFTFHHPCRLAVFATLSVLDLALTYQLIQESGGRIYESNPIAGAWLSKYGWSGMALYKMLSMSIVVAVAAFISYSRPLAGGRLLTFACAAVALVVGYSYSLKGTAGDRQLAHYDRRWTPEELDRYISRSPKLTQNHGRGSQGQGNRTKPNSPATRIDAHGSTAAYPVADVDTASPPSLTIAE
jgi:hypothetical protein